MYIAIVFNFLIIYLNVDTYVPVYVDSQVCTTTTNAQNDKTANTAYT